MRGKLIRICCGNSTKNFIILSPDAQVLMSEKMVQIFTTGI